MKNSIVFYFLIVLTVVSCKKKEEKPTEIEEKPYLKSFIEEKPEKKPEVVNYDKNISEISVDDFINDVKEKNYTSFHYYFNAKKVNESPKLKKANDELFELIGNREFLLGVQLKNIDDIRNGDDSVNRHMLIKLTRHNVKDEELEAYFTKLKELLSKIHEKK